ncbi:SEL1-like repeat protein [Photobacterium damselae]|uniref:SEL1-like repeat protein n=1 Tax=Photobacterium damselae TaxID=38293 RepID=UPI003C6DF05B
MKKLLLSSLVILSGCTLDSNNEMQNTTDNTITNIQQNIDKLTELDQIISTIEEKKTSDTELKKQLEKLSYMANENSDAMLYLASLYEEGDIISKNLALARSYYSKSAQKNNILARYYYALMLIDGRGGETNHKEAKELLQTNIKDNHEQSTYALAYLHFIDKDYQKTINILSTKKSINSPSSKYLLGISLLEQNQNIDKAVELLTQSSTEKNIYASHALGKIYAHGKHGQLKDPKKSFFYLKQAVQDNDPNALYDLAMLTLENPELIDNDYNASIEKLINADKYGNKFASFEIAKLYDQGNIVKQNYEKAIYWYKRSAEKGNNRAMYNLASMYANGDGVSVSMSDAEFWLKQSAQYGNQRAIELLK